MMILLICCVAVASFDSADRFLDEYPSQVAGLKKRLEGVHGTAEIMRVTAGKKGTPRPAQFATITNSFKCELEIRGEGSKPGAPGLTFVICRVGGHCFRLEKEIGTRNYRPTLYGDGPRENAVIRGEFGEYTEVAWSILGKDLAEWMTLRYFKFKEARGIARGDRQLVEVSLESGDDPAKLANIHAILDPALDWAIVSSEISLAHMPGRSKRTEVKYSKVSDEGFYMSEVEVTGMDYITRRCVFKQVAFGSLPQSEFTMEHYGLVDPAHKPREGARWTFWLGSCVLLVVALLLGGWFKRLATRTGSKVALS